MDADDREVLALAQQALRENAPALLVLDNVPRPGSVRELGIARHAALLLTSRHPAWSPPASVHEVSVFSESQALTLLSRYASEADADVLPMLATDLGHLPLALAQAGAYLQLTGQSATGFRTLLAERLDALDPPWEVVDAAGRYERSVKAMLALLLEQLDTDELRTLVALHAQFAPEAVPRELLRSAAAHSPPTIAQFAANELALDHALVKLNVAAILRVGPGGSVMHRLTARAARDTATDEHELADAVLQALLENFPEDPMATSSWPQAAPLLAHAYRVLENVEALASEPGAQLALRVCALDHVQGRLAQAEALADRARQALPETERLLQARLLHVIGRTRLKSGKIPEAVDVLTRALAILDDEGEGESLDYATVETTLGAVLTELDTREAPDRLKHALAIQRLELPADDKRIARTLIELAGHLHIRGKYRAAEQLEREAIAIVDRPGADAGVDLARGLGNLAGTLSEIPERRDETIEVARRALEVTREVYGEEHPEVAYPLTTLGAMLAEEDPQEGYQLLLEALRLRLAAFGPHHEQVAYTLEHLGDVLSHADEPERALVWLQQAHELLRDVFDDDHVEVATAALGLGQTLGALGQDADARPFLVTAADVLTRTYGADHPEARAAQDALAANREDS